MKPTTFQPSISFGLLRFIIDSYDALVSNMEVEDYDECHTECAQNCVNETSFLIQGMVDDFTACDDNFGKHLWEFCGNNDMDFELTCQIIFDITGKNFTTSPLPPNTIN